MFDAQILKDLRKCEAAKSKTTDELSIFVQSVFDAWDAYCASHDMDSDDALDDFVDETVLALAGEDMDASLDAAELIDALVPYLVE